MTAESILSELVSAVDLAERTIGAGNPAMRMTPPIWRAIEKARKYQAEDGANVEKLKAAIERMRVAGGRREFQAAFDAAKDLIRGGEKEGEAWTAEKLES